MSMAMRFHDGSVRLSSLNCKIGAEGPPFASVNKLLSALLNILASMQ